MRVSIHQYLVAIVQNLTKIIKHGDTEVFGTSDNISLGALINGVLNIFTLFFKAHNLKMKFYSSFC